MFKFNNNILKFLFNNSKFYHLFSLDIPSINFLFIATS